MTLITKYLHLCSFEPDMVVFHCHYLHTNYFLQLTCIETKDVAFEKVSFTLQLIQISKEQQSFCYETKLKKKNPKKPNRIKFGEVLSQRVIELH